MVSFTFPGQNEPRLGHETPWVNSGTIPAIPGRLASLWLSLMWIFNNISVLALVKWRTAVENLKHDVTSVSAQLSEGSPFTCPRVHLSEVPVVRVMVRVRPGPL